DPDGTTTIAGIEAGRYRLALETGHTWDKPTVLGEVDVDVAAGGSTRVILDIKRRAEARKVPFSGTAHISPEWKARYCDFHFSPVAVPGAGSADGFEILLDQMKPVEG